VMSTSVCYTLCVSVCLSVREDISGTSRAIFTNFSVDVAYGHCSVLLWQGDEIQRGRGSFEGFLFPTDNALYSIAFGTHTKTAEPIEMPFRTMTRVGRRYHVLDGGPDPPKRTAAILGENVKSTITSMPLPCSLQKGSVNRQ